MLDDNGDTVCTCLNGFAGEFCECFVGAELGIAGLLAACSGNNCCQPANDGNPACDESTLGTVCPNSCNGARACRGRKVEENTANEKFRPFTGYASSDSCINSPEGPNTSACAGMQGFVKSGSCKGSSACALATGYIGSDSCFGTGFNSAVESGTCQGMEGQVASSYCLGNVAFQCNGPPGKYYGDRANPDNTRDDIESFLRVGSCPTPPANFTDACEDFLKCCANADVTTCEPGMVVKQDIVFGSGMTGEVLSGGSTAWGTFCPSSASLESAAASRKQDLRLSSSSRKQSLKISAEFWHQ